MVYMKSMSSKHVTETFILKHKLLLFSLIQMIPHKNESYTPVICSNYEYQSASP